MSGRPSGSESGGLEDIFDNFCYMAVEEFLQKKGLHSTLGTLREEWQRPDEDKIVVSWFEVALKLRLPELISQNSKDRSVLENLVQALIRESSVRNRQTPEVLLTGLAKMPKTSTLPTIVDHQEHQQFSTSSMPTSPNKPRQKGHKDKEVPKNVKEVHYIKRQLESMEKIQTMGNAKANKNVNLSNEAWIPSDFRMKTLGRDISAATDTLLVIKKREFSLAREMKRLLVSDLERARTEERLDATHKIPCECCMLEFLYVNLPLKVSRKAIFDIRAKWSGKLSSATVFGGVEMMTEEEEEAANKSPSKSRQQVAMEKKNQLLATVPSCYDEVGVCVFCAQFFQIQEEYRPSYLSITAEERRAAMRVVKRREEEYWDPLKMVQKDREAAEALQAAAAMAASQAGSAVMSSEEEEGGANT
ncbi:hypothetical protein B484DRAFT_87111 [Ochromonadaceae sp. CCMP2298]|nr:hypothetical protein B484DRAFT_87111 [Ochromonadaceae sp. CCMP2298]|mmetsp:Transcript_26900/g.57953  ORF Transcript_26900/g.57953 Transcript_26900/m.57953 type:complete len:417 (-) Transcript_26900:38-1288(-)